MNTFEVSEIFHINMCGIFIKNLFPTMKILLAFKRGSSGPCSAIRIILGVRLDILREIKMDILKQWLKIPHTAFVENAVTDNSYVFYKADQEANFFFVISQIGLKITVFLNSK